MSELIDSARNHCNASIEDAWKEFERTGEISNSAELIINAAEFYQKYACEADNQITQLEKDKAELVEMLSHLLNHDCINDHTLDLEVEVLLERMK